MDKQILIKSKYDMKRGLEKLIVRYLWIKEHLNNETACTKAECECMLELIKEREVLEKILREFGIQDFQLESEWIEVEVN